MQWTQVSTPPSRRQRLWSISTRVVRFDLMQWSVFNVIVVTNLQSTRATHRAVAEWSAQIEHTGSMSMTNLNSEIRELNIEELDAVSGGMRFFGMNCSVNQNNAIGAIVDLFEGTFLEGAAVAAGQALCS